MKQPETGKASSFFNKVLCGDARTLAGKLPAELVDTIVTSPPYFRQRDYGDGRQIGNEAEPEQYVQRLIATFDAIRPALKSGGSMWLVLGDKYVRGELLGMPWRVALALKDGGWHLRAECIWHKPNAMPSSARLRPTVDHETIFLFSRDREYFYDADAVREPHVTFGENSRMKGGRKHLGRRGGTPERGKNAGNNNLHDGRWDQAFHPLGRNRRTVWSVPLSKFRDAHFAVFPEVIVETCIKATCPAGGLVLDPFAGSGTTAVVARRLQRNFLAFDCSAAYCRLARRRLAPLSDLA
jgi:site-specific DNA-methyltransferase (adenine-specific)